MTVSDHKFRERTALLKKSFNDGLIYVLALCFLLLFIAALLSGPSPLQIAALSDTWLHDKPTLDALIFTELRLPRALLAASVGAVLGLAGASMQGLLRNPLAEPELMGVSSCAALGAVLALYYGLSVSSGLLQPLMGMAGAGVSVLLLFLLAGKKASAMSLLLAGVALSSLAGSGIALALNFAPNPYAMSEMVYWLLGSFANRTLNEFYFAAPFMLLGAILMLKRAAFLSALSLGEDTAQTLGFEVKRERGWMIIGVALSVGAAVSVSGSIGFIGLLVPHLMRPLVGHEPGRVLGVSALAGAGLMLLADIAVQLISPQQELKIGVVTALVGAPFFFYLVLTMRSRLS